MMTDFDLIVHRLPECKEAKLYIIGDLHIESIECNKKAWESFVEKVLQEQNTYLVIIGDMMNNATKHSVSNCYDDTMRPSEAKRYLANSLKPLAPKILGLVPGNHEARNMDVDDCPLYDIAAKLDIEHLFRPNMAFIKVCFGSRKKDKDGHQSAEQTYVIAMTHGSGGGILPGATINRNERFAYIMENVDLLCVGHTHKGQISKPSRIVVDIRNDLIMQKSMTVVSACSWLSYGGYAMRKMLIPSAPQDPEQPQTILLGGTRRKRYIKTVW